MPEGALFSTSLPAWVTLNGTCVSVLQPSAGLCPGVTLAIGTANIFLPPSAPPWPAGRLPASPALLELLLPQQAHQAHQCRRDLAGCRLRAPPAALETGQLSGLLFGCFRATPSRRSAFSPSPGCEVWRGAQELGRVHAACAPGERARGSVELWSPVSSLLCELGQDTSPFRLLPPPA